MGGKQSYFGAPYDTRNLGSGSAVRPYAASPYATARPAGVSPAYALDAADGVIDGRYYGSPIVQCGPPQYAPQYAQPAFAAPVAYAAPAPVTYTAPTQKAAYALDAADGVIDGRYYGNQVAVNRPPHGHGHPHGRHPPISSAYAPVAYATTAPAYAAPTYVTPATGYYQPTRPSTSRAHTPMAYATSAPVTYSAPTYVTPAMHTRPALTYAAQSYAAPNYAYGTVAAPSQPAAYALDAADGVIDGRYFGSQVAVTRPTYTAPMTYAAPVSYAAPAPMAYSAPTYAIGAPTQAAAYSLDAADGRIDGRYFGSQVAVTSPSSCSPCNPTPYGAMYTQPTATAPSQAAAFRLDASDGVIDGRYFGSPVAVTHHHHQSYAAPTTSYAASPITSYATAPYSPTYSPTMIATTSQSNAFALDSADGLIDGRYFGTQVGVASPYAASHW